jgi:hypothetical protein
LPLPIIWPLNYILNSFNLLSSLGSYLKLLFKLNFTNHSNQNCKIKIFHHSLTTQRYNAQPERALTHFIANFSLACVSHNNALSLEWFLNEQRYASRIILIFFRSFVCNIVCGKKENSGDLKGIFGIFLLCKCILLLKQKNKIIYRS